MLGNCIVAVVSLIFVVIGMATKDALAFSGWLVALLYVLGYIKEKENL